MAVLALPALALPALVLLTVPLLVEGRAGAGGAPWLQYRDRIWAAGWELFLAKPFTGHGLGAFRTVYPAAARFDTGEIVHRAHNDWLEWMVEGGLAAPLPMAALGVLVCLQLRQRPWLLGVPLVLAHSLVDYPLDRFLILFLLASLTGMAFGEHSWPAPGERHLRARKRLSVPPSPH